MDRQAFDTRSEMELGWDSDSSVVDVPKMEEEESRSVVGAEDVEPCGEGVLNVPHISLSCSVRSRGFCMNMQNEETR